MLRLCIIPGGLETQVTIVTRLGRSGSVASARSGGRRRRPHAAHVIASGSAATYGWPTTPALRLGMDHEDQRCAAWSRRVPRLQPPVALETQITPFASVAAPGFKAT